MNQEIRPVREGIPALQDREEVKRLVTFGHGTASADRIVALLRAAGVELVVDVRTAPGSRRNPHVARGELERWLPEHGIAYRWDKRLGGFRRPPADSPDVFWKEGMFRGYAAHMRTAEFAAAIEVLLAESRLQAVMCSESLWWRCHRRMIADFLALIHDVPVRHLLHDGRLVPHDPSPGARVAGDLLVYDGGQESLI
jgi:uncharacterized protein (DUF488 family)